VKSEFSYLELVISAKLHFSKLNILY